MLSRRPTKVWRNNTAAHRFTTVGLITFLAFVSSAVVAHEIPRAVHGYALQLEAECAAGPNPGALSTTHSPDLIKLAADGPRGKIFIVDGASTRCGDSAPLCGTGGCPLGIFRIKNGVTTNLYDAQAHPDNWSISSDGSAITFHVHGSWCGGSGPDPCAIEISLATGSQKTFRPR